MVAGWVVRVATDEPKDSGFVSKSEMQTIRREHTSKFFKNVICDVDWLRFRSEVGSDNLIVWTPTGIGFLDPETGEFLGQLDYVENYEYLPEVYPDEEA
jgi:hypothetical protein